MILGKDKVAFLNTPTPLHRLDRVSEDLGVEFYMKRDDLTNFGTGGNKLRKLEYLLKDALDAKATMLLTVGGAQTNHGRLTAAVAAKYGLKSAIVAVDEYPGELSANLLLDGIMDCHVYLVKPVEGKRYMEQLNEAVERVTREWEERGERVYFIPMGGSNEVGALGYYECALELAEQINKMGLGTAGQNAGDENLGQNAGVEVPGQDPETDDLRWEARSYYPRVFVTVGSYGTYTGLAAAITNEDLPMRLTGIAIAPFPDLKGGALEHYEGIRRYCGLSKEMTEDDLDLIDDYDFGDYNNPVKEVREAIYYMGRMEGIILDPCYTGKTFNGILQMIRKGEIQKGETIIMIHTGGVPGIYTPHHRVEMEKELIDHIHIL